MTFRNLLLPLIFLCLLHSQAWPQLGVWRHPETGEKAVITVGARHPQRSFDGPRSAPVLGVFPSGEIWWSVDYFDERRFTVGAGKHWDEDMPSLAEMRREVFIEVMESMPEEVAADREKRDDYIAEHYPNHPDFQALLEIARYVAYFQASVDLQLVQETLRQVRASGFHGVREIGVLGHDSYLYVAVLDNELYHSISGPYGYFLPSDLQEVPPWEHDAGLEENWRRLVTSLLSIVNAATADDMPEHVIMPRTIGRLSYLRYTEDVTVVFPDFDLPSGASDTIAEFTRKARDASAWNDAEAVLYIKSSLPLLPDDRKYIAHASIGYLESEREDNDAAMEAFSVITNRQVDSDPVALADANIRMGYLALREGRTYDALDHFGRIATGKVPATHDQVEEAAYRLARILHRTDRGVQAVDVYSQLVEHARDPERKRSARLQLSGLLFELAKGDFGEVDEEERLELLEQTRTESTFLIEDPDTEPENRVVAELMYLETFYYQDDQQKCLDLGIEFVDRWTAWRDENPELVDWNINVQLSAAHNFATFSAYEVGEYELTIELARQIRERYGEGDHYRTFNVFAYSLLYEAFAQEALGNHAEGERLRERCREEYPDWYRTIGRREARNLGLPHSMLD